MDSGAFQAASRRRMATMEMIEEANGESAVIAFGEVLVRVLFGREVEVGKESGRRGRKVQRREREREARTMMKLAQSVSASY